MLRVLREKYDVSAEWQGNKYAGINLDCDYNQRNVLLPVPGYYKEALVRFRHELNNNRYQPHLHTGPRYEQTIQYKKE